MNKAPTLPEKPPSKMASILAGIGGFIVLVVLMWAFYGDDVPKSYPVIEAPILEDGADRSWFEETGVNLPPIGNLPSLQTAMRSNDELRKRVEAFAMKDDAEIFANYKRTDADIAAILLLWGGANLADAGMTNEGLDVRVDRFIRSFYSMPALELITNNPRLGGVNPWPRLFAHYKVRLIAQAQGGSAPFQNPVTYNLQRDSLSVQGGLSRSFFASFGEFLRGQKDAIQYRNNLLRYLEAVNPSLTNADRQTLALVRSNPI